MASPRMQEVSKNLVKLAIPEKVVRETEIAYSPKVKKSGCWDSCFGFFSRKYPAERTSLQIATAEQKSAEYRSLPRSSSMD